LRLVEQGGSLVEPSECLGDPGGAGGAVEGGVAEAAGLQLVEGREVRALAQVSGPGGDEAVKPAEAPRSVPGAALEDLAQAVEQVGGGEWGHRAIAPQGWGLRAAPCMRMIDRRDWERSSCVIWGVLIDVILETFF
jgi:hypothetical protein